MCRRLKIGFPSYQIHSHFESIWEQISFPIGMQRNYCTMPTISLNYYPFFVRMNDKIYSVCVRLGSGEQLHEHWNLKHKPLLAVIQCVVIHRNLYTEHWTKIKALLQLNAKQKVYERCNFFLKILIDVVKVCSKKKKETLVCTIRCSFREECKRMRWSKQMLCSYGLNGAGFIRDPVYSSSISSLWQRRARGREREMENARKGFIGVLFVYTQIHPVRCFFSVFFFDTRKPCV